MKKQIFLFAVAALALASCSSENDVVQTPNVVEQTVDDGVVVFDSYVNRGTTRSVGKSGVIDLPKLKDGHEGFGVFGYYTNSERYSGITKPNFFYNQNVEYDPTGTRWVYTPVKYWPNEFGTDAISDQVDRVTFFAYAPWVDVDPLTGLVKKGTNDTDDYATTNIISMTRNNVTGDPHIRYSASMDPTNCTDLLYGVAAENFTSSNSSVNVNNIAKGNPYKDVVKPGTDANSKIKFDFKHALAQLRVYIDANVVDMTNGNISETVDDSHTRIWVRSVTFEGITKEGSLNLNSIAPEAQWYDINGVNKITTGSFSVYDGLKDGREPLEKATTESPATFNTDLIQTKKYKTTSGSIDATGGFPKGVTQVEKPLFQGGETVFAIPTGEKMKVTIVYDVETVDQNLAFYLSDGETQGSTIENKISKTIETFGSIKSGYCYTLKLHLGMRTVDFDAQVTDWLNDGADIDLPSNLQTFAAKPAADNAKGTINLPWNVGSYDFAVSGLKVNSTASFKSGNEPTNINIASADQKFTPVNSAGISKVSLSNIPNNNTINNITDNWVIHDGNGNQVTLTATQFAAPLGVKINEVGVRHIRLGKDNGSAWSEIIENVTSKDQIIVSRNGQEMVCADFAGDYPTEDNIANINRAADLLTLYFKNDFVPGDVITVWIQGGDASEESVTVKIGGVMPVATQTIPYKTVAHAPILPDLVGPGLNQVSNYDWTASATTYFDLDGAKNITTKKAGTDETLKAELTDTYKTEAEKEGWYFPGTLDETTFTLNVERQGVKITFANGKNPAPEAATLPYASGTTVCTNLATAKSVLENNTLTGVSYTIETVNGATDDIAKFDANTTPGTLKTADALNPDTEYVVVVKAKRDVDTQYSYAEDTYTVKFKTAAP